MVDVMSIEVEVPYTHVSLQFFSPFDPKDGYELCM